MTSYQHATPAPRRPWRWVWLGLALAVVAFAGLFAWDGWQLRGAAADLQTHAAAAQAAVRDRDAVTLQGEVMLVQDAAERFAHATDGPHWWVADHLPWVGQQTVPLRQAGESVLAVAEGALAPIAAMEDLSALEAPQIVNGRIDPQVLAPYRDTLAQAAAVMNDELAALAEVSLDGTVGYVSSRYLDLESQLAELGAIVQGGHVAAEVLPTMLGGEGARTYLVMVQNNAEPRATGGIPGAVLEVRVDDGRMEMVGYSAAGALVVPEGLDFPLTADELRLFTERMVIYPQDVNFTPEYPRSAQLMAAFWKNSFGEDVDGVVSVDPVALGYMLEGMPPTDVAGVTITGDTLAHVMLHLSYQIFPDPQDSDAFFALAAGELFGQILSGGTSAIAGVERAIDEGRFMVWSADETEQALLATAPIAGEFLERTDALGVFLNDGSGSKIGYYIANDTTVTDRRCEAGGLAGQTVEVSLTHTYEGDVAALPEYVAGGWLEPAGEFHANLMLYPAVGTGVAGVTLDGEPAQLYASTHDGRAFTSVRVVLEPGQTVMVTYDIVALEAAVLPPSLVMTPGPTENLVTRTTDSGGAVC